MNTFMLIAAAIAGFLLLFFIALWVHAFIARTFGAETGTKTRVLIAGILTNIALFIIALVLSNTLLPELGNIFVDASPDDVTPSKNKLNTVVFYIAPIVALLLGTLIFSLCVRLGIIKSFFTLVIGALATTLFAVAAAFGLSLLGVDQHKMRMAFQPEFEATTKATSTNTVLVDAQENSKIHAYLGSRQSKRLAIQQMAQNVCGCANEPDCVADTFETYRMFAERHHKSYSDDREGFLVELEAKVAFCAGELNPELSKEIPMTTNVNLEIAIRQYHDELGKWAGTYRMDDILKQENRRQKDGTYIAHLRYRYTPTENSGIQSDGIDSRTFDYHKNEDGSYSVSAMGKQDSARLLKPDNTAQAKWYPVSIAALDNYDGVKLKVTRIVGEPLEGNLINVSNTHVTVFIKRRDGEISYEIERDNISSIDAWY